MAIINSQDQNSYKNPGVGTIIGGVVAGSVVNSIVKMPLQFGAPKLMEKMAVISRELNADEFNSVEKAIKESIEKSGLAEKGVGIIKATEENKDEITKIMQYEMDNSKICKFLPEKLKGFVGKIVNSMVHNGQNAFYTFSSKKIIMPEKELCLAVFHEAGHAANQNLSTIGKILQKCRPLSLLGVPISLIAMWKTKKAPDEQPTGTADKTTNFIKENAGKLTFATFIPMLLEEGLASIKGNNFAKNLLSPELAKKVAKTNALGFMTYAALATLSSIGLYAGVKVKDAIAKPELVEHVSNNKVK